MIKRSAIAWMDIIVTIFLIIFWHRLKLFKKKNFVFNKILVEHRKSQYWWLAEDFFSGENHILSRFFRVSLCDCCFRNRLVLLQCSTFHSSLVFESLYVWGTRAARRKRIYLNQYPYVVKFKRIRKKWVLYKTLLQNRNMKSYHILLVVVNF